MGWMSTGERSTAERHGGLGLTGHVATAVDAVASASVAGHSQSPRPQPAADLYDRALTLLLIGVVASVVLATGCLRSGRGTLPLLRGPPHSLSSR